jgi:folate-dependent phosphoribosylglycinamide formyltransferase PurN
MAKKWIALFSQTGSEIVNISEAVGRTPDLVLTNNKDPVQWNSGIRQLCKNITVDSHDKLMDYLRSNEEFAPEDTVITLHGYLRIIPEDVCGSYIMFNGHPAPIHLYPELKGKDKQEDLYKYRYEYPRIGCVIHRVTSTLDDGVIIINIDAENNLTSIEDAYTKLKHLSLESWKEFFNDYLPNKISN